MSRQIRALPICEATPAVDVLRWLIGRWKMLIVLQLGAGDRGFAELRRALPGVSEKVLTQQLDALAHDGLVLRSEIRSRAPKIVRYALTDWARSEVLPLVEQMQAIGRRHRERRGPLADGHAPAQRERLGTAAPTAVSGCRPPA